MRIMLVFVLLLISVVPTHAGHFDLVKFFNELFFPTGKVLQATVCGVEFQYRECTSCLYSAELWYNTCSGYERRNYTRDEACSSCEYCSLGTGSCSAKAIQSACNEQWSCSDSSTKLFVGKDCSISKFKCDEGEKCIASSNYAKCEACTPEWECSGWSACSDNKKQRVCVDANSCSDVNSYTEKAECDCKDECTAGEKQCTEDGYITCGNYDSDSCSEWNFTACAEGESCKDYNGRVRCEGPCKEELTCDSWSDCTNGKKQRICYDANFCSEDFTVEKERCGIFEDIMAFFRKLIG